LPISKYALFATTIQCLPPWPPVLAGVLFGVMPLWQIFKTDPNDAIKNAGTQSLAGRRWALRDILLAA
jgi:hypothetical protein